MLDLLFTRTPNTSQLSVKWLNWLNINARLQSTFLEYVLFCEIFLQIPLLVGHILAHGKYAAKYGKNQMIPRIKKLKFS